MTTGKFITFEGGEGAGKSTQVRRLAALLQRAGIDHLTTREPGGAPSAEDIRRLLVDGEPGRWQPMTEALLHYAALREHLDATILPALAAGRWVICDRFADSTMAYQGYGHGLGREAILQIHRIVAADARPDLTLILDIDVEKGLARARSRAGGEDRYERMDRAFHERLRDGFREIAQREPGRCRIIDADGDPDTVAERIKSAVAECLRVELQ